LDSAEKRGTPRRDADRSTGIGVRVPRLAVFGLQSFVSIVPAWDFGAVPVASLEQVARCLFRMKPRK
jgi:hypothetical protein